MAAFRRNALTFLITFCIAFLIFGIVACILLTTFFGPLDKNTFLNQEDTEDLIVGFEEISDSEDALTSSFTALIVGTDYQPDVTPDAPERADSIILVRFSSENKSVVYMNIPTITQITVDGNTTTLSKAFTDKGIDYLSEKVQGLTGLHVTYYAVASVDLFDDLIDALGGVNYTVPINMEYEDEAQALKIDLKKGTYDLKGADALNMLRYCSDSYSNRMLRNVQFLRTLVEKYTQASYKEQANDLYKKVFANLRSNFTENDMIKHLDTIYSYSTYEGKVLTFPGDYKNDSDELYFVPETEEAMQMLAEYKNY